MVDYLRNVYLLKTCIKNFAYENPRNVFKHFNPRKSLHKWLLKYSICVVNRSVRHFTYTCKYVQYFYSAV